MRRGSGSLSARLSSRTTVLVVEDEADIAGFLGAYFRASGLELVHVNPRKPDEVVEAVRENNAACVLLDLNLIGFSGLEVLDAFRRDPALATIPVVVVSAYTAEEPRCYELGARAFVAKPFNVSDLFDSVSALVGGTVEDSDDSDDDDNVADRINRAIDDARHAKEAVSLALVRVPGGDPSRIAAALPDTAVVVRTGAEEVAVLLPGAATGKAQRALAGAVAALNGACAGVACAPEHATTTDELYMAADAALADACDSGQPVATAK